MSQAYILSVLSIAAFKLTTQRRRQLEYITRAYILTRDIPAARWCPSFHDKEFDRRSLFGHYASLIGADGPSSIRSQLMVSHLRAALNDFTVCEYEIGVVLEGIAPGPVPFSYPGGAIPDYKAIAMSLLQLIISEYPEQTKRRKDTRRYRPIDKPLADIRLPYKD